MSANFVSQKIFIEGFAVILEVKPVLILNKPICVGFSILDLRIINVWISLKLH